MKLSLSYSTPILISFLVFFQVACAQDKEDPLSQVMPEVKVDNTSMANTSQAGIVTSYADVLEEATPSVVSIYTRRIQQIAAGNPQEDIIRRYFGLPPLNSPSQEQSESVPTGMGSGVIVSSDGYIITNNHVISAGQDEPADEISVRLGDGREFDATLVGRDPQTDIAVLKIEANNLNAITFTDSEILRVGDIAFAIGNPMGVGITVTSGIVSALGRSDLGILGRGGYENFIQVDAPINMGNSGGALIDAKGRLIGINTAIYSRSGGSIGIGFAIPSNLAYKIMKSLIDSGEVNRGYLGVFPADLDIDLAEAFGLTDTNGALINSVQEGGPADKAGIKKGDVITKVGDKTVTSARQFRFLISRQDPGTEVSMTVVRNNDTLNIDVVLGNLNGDPIASLENKTTDTGLAGVRLKPVDDAMRSELDLPNDFKGVLITAIDESSPFVRKLAPGMIISEINGQKISDVADVAESLQKGLNKIYLFQQGYSMFITLRIP